MAEEVYRLERVSYRYGDVVALRAIDLVVSVGESVAVLGANGSGKSTLLKILDGLYFPTSGTVSFFGRQLKKGLNPRALRERVGFVFCEPDFQLFCQTVFDEVSFGPLQLGLPEEEVRRRAEDILSLLGLSALRERPPYSLSSGEKKRVAIASVLSMNPDVLLLDEPTTGLDPRTQVWLMELLIELKRLKKTSVIATHDLSLAWDVSDRAVVLNEDHGAVADGLAPGILRDKKLLLSANLIHEHAHRHGETVHTHSHGPFSVHNEHES
ncbi:MAG: ABC transporter ATP-binding protein [Deltaproteobacteria bacterium]|nr:ABC transporter ATP-binding protein [Deltaproteobacteria bacterium]